MRQKRDIKSILKFAFNGRCYVSHAQLAAAIVAQQGDIAAASVRHVLWELCGRGAIHSVGRGWYSTLTSAAKCATESIATLSDLLKTEFPWVESMCWSTHQIAALCPHLPMRYYNFVYVPREAMRDAGLKVERNYPEARVAVNPAKNDRSWMNPAEENYIVRPLSSDSRLAPGMVAPIEALLVELSLERVRMSLFDESDWSVILHDVLRGGWVNPGNIARRIRRRGVDKAEFSPLIRELAELGAKINERHKPQISDKRLILSSR